MFAASTLVDTLGARTGLPLPALKLAFPFFASTLSELASLAVLVPFDTLRTRVQSGHSDYQQSLAAGIRLIVRNEGLMRLFRSSNVYAINILLYTGLQFQLLETFRYLFQSQSLFLMLGATCLSTVLTSPCEFVMTRHVMVDSRVEKPSILGLVRKHYREEGLKAMMRGTTPRLLVNLGYNLTWFPIYSYLKKYGWTQQN